MFYAGALVKWLTRFRPPAAARRLGSLLLAPPLGPAPSSLTELFLFRKSRWMQQFTAASFRIVACRPAGIFHTGYILLPGLAMDSRRRLARYLGSSCTVFVMAPSG